MAVLQQALAPLGFVMSGRSNAIFHRHSLQTSRAAHVGQDLKQSGMSNAGLVSTLGLGAAAVITSAGKRSRGAAMVCKAATSYKDFKDPWLGSCDFGFDPLKLTVTEGTFDGGKNRVPETVYYNYRESEVKHGRFAMGAFLAIFAEDNDRNALLHQLGQVSVEDKLDGTLGLDEIQAPVFLVFIGIQALAEYNLQSSEKDDDFLAVEYNKDRCPGDLGFDPLGLGKGGLKGNHNLEVNLGRLAMIGITTFLFKEFLVKDASVVGKLV
eukprot:TRINITY_DN456_c0_g1_i1.p1 TRINITY_DN456_c0_g1~~TRINITY_DN456_c0_g1_i1.p1  ORF type:complete len:267 (-),score=65.12 TRINITY_DN456_c0_g1_i1:84-884(-)